MRKVLVDRREDEESIVKRRHEICLQSILRTPQSGAWKADSEIHLEDCVKTLVHRL